MRGPLWRGAALAAAVLGQVHATASPTLAPTAINRDFLECSQQDSTKCACFTQTTFMTHKLGWVNDDSSVFRLRGALSPSTLESSGACGKDEAGVWRQYQPLASDEQHCLNDDAYYSDVATSGLVLDVVYHDMSDIDVDRNNPDDIGKDFNCGAGSAGMEPEMLVSHLATDGLPVANPESADVGQYKKITSVATFHKWYHDSPETVRWDTRNASQHDTSMKPLELRQVKCRQWTDGGPYTFDEFSADPSNLCTCHDPSAAAVWRSAQKECKADIPRYSFCSKSFFPLYLKTDVQGRSGIPWFFTSHIATEFRFQGHEYFKFSGDDDLWVFINGILVIDMGGVHPEKCRRISLSTAYKSATRSEGYVDETLCGYPWRYPTYSFVKSDGTLYTPRHALTLVPGGKYTLDIFHAERCKAGSNFYLETNMKLIPRKSESAGSDDLCLRMQWDRGSDRAFRKSRLVRPVTGFNPQHALVTHGVCGGVINGDPIPDTGMWSTSGSKDPTVSSCNACCDCTYSFDEEKCKNSGQVYGASMFYAYNYPSTSSSNIGLEAAETENVFFLRDVNDQVFLVVNHDKAGNSGNPPDPANPSKPSGKRCNMEITSPPNDHGAGGKGVFLQLRDDYQPMRDSCVGASSDCYAWDTKTGNGTFAWKWASCCTDGMVMGPLPADGFQLNLKYTYTAGLDYFKLGDYDAASASLNLIDLTHPGKKKDAYFAEGIQVNGFSCAAYCEGIQECGECTNDPVCGWCSDSQHAFGGTCSTITKRGECTTTYTESGCSACESLCAFTDLEKANGDDTCITCTSRNSGCGFMVTDPGTSFLAGKCLPGNFVSACNNADGKAPLLFPAYEHTTLATLNNIAIANHAGFTVEAWVFPGASSAYPWLSLHRGTTECFRVQSVFPRLDQWSHVAVVYIPQSLSTLHFAPKWANTCDYGTSVTEDLCQAASLILTKDAYPSRIPGRDSMAVGTDDGRKGAWGGVPSGCSAQTAGDLTAHFKKGASTMKQNGGYQLICSDAAHAVVAVYIDGVLSTAVRPAFNILCTTQDAASPLAWKLEVGGTKAGKQYARDLTVSSVIVFKGGRTEEERALDKRDLGCTFPWWSSASETSKPGWVDPVLGSIMVEDLLYPMLPTPPSQLISGEVTLDTYGGGQLIAAVNMSTRGGCSSPESASYKERWMSVCTTPYPTPNPTASPTTDPTPQPTNTPTSFPTASLDPTIYPLCPRDAPVVTEYQEVFDSSGASGCCSGSLASRAKKVLDSATRLECQAVADTDSRASMYQMDFFPKGTSNGGGCTDDKPECIGACYLWYQPHSDTAADVPRDVSVNGPGRNCVSRSPGTQCWVKSAKLGSGGVGEAPSISETIDGVVTPEEGTVDINARIWSDMAAGGYYFQIKTVPSAVKGGRFFKHRMAYPSLPKPQEFGTLPSRHNPPHPVLYRCEGDCDFDAECAPGLVCHHRDNYDSNPPGCECDTPFTPLSALDWNSGTVLKRGTVNTKATRELCEESCAAITGCVVGMWLSGTVKHGECWLASKIAARPKEDFCGKLPGQTCEAFQKTLGTQELCGKSHYDYCVDPNMVTAGPGIVTLVSNNDAKIYVGYVPGIDTSGMVPMATSGCTSWTKTTDSYWERGGAKLGNVADGSTVEEAEAVCCANPKCAGFSFAKPGLQRSPAGYYTTLPLERLVSNSEYDGYFRPGFAPGTNTNNGFGSKLLNAGWTQEPNAVSMELTSAGGSFAGTKITMQFMSKLKVGGVPLVLPAPRIGGSFAGVIIFTGVSATSHQVIDVTHTYSSRVAMYDEPFTPFASCAGDTTCDVTCGTFGKLPNTTRSSDGSFNPCGYAPYMGNDVPLGVYSSSNHSVCTAAAMGYGAAWEERCRRLCSGTTCWSTHIPLSAHEATVSPSTATVPYEHPFFPLPTSFSWPDDAADTLTFNVTGSSLGSDVGIARVELRFVGLRHSKVGDLTLHLTSPGGVTVELLKGGNSNPCAGNHFGGNLEFCGMNCAGDDKWEIAKRRADAVAHTDARCVSDFYGWNSPYTSPARRGSGTMSCQGREYQRMVLGPASGSKYGGTYTWSSSEGSAMECAPNDEQMGSNVGRGTILATSLQDFVGPQMAAAGRWNLTLGDTTVGNVGFFEYVELILHSTATDVPASYLPEGITLAYPPTREGSLLLDSNGSPSAEPLRVGSSAGSEWSDTTKMWYASPLTTPMTEMISFKTVFGCVPEMSRTALRTTTTASQIPPQSTWADEVTSSSATVEWRFNEAATDVILSSGTASRSLSPMTRVSTAETLGTSEYQCWRSDATTFTAATCATAAGTAGVYISAGTTGTNTVCGRIGDLTATWGFASQLKETAAAHQLKISTIVCSGINTPVGATDVQTTVTASRVSPTQCSRNTQLSVVPPLASPTNHLCWRSGASSVTSATCTTAGSGTPSIASGTTGSAAVCGGPGISSALWADVSQLKLSVIECDSTAATEVAAGAITMQLTPGWGTVLWINGGRDINGWRRFALNPGTNTYALNGLIPGSSYTFRTVQVDATTGAMSIRSDPATIKTCPANCIECDSAGVCLECDASSLLLIQPPSNLCIAIFLDDCPNPSSTPGNFFGNGHNAGTQQCFAGSDVATCKKCNSCPIGFVRAHCSGFTPGACKQCEPGFYKSIVGTDETLCTKCTVCSAESYAVTDCNSVSDAMCSLCPLNATSVEGSVGLSACVCASGFYMSDEVCVPCDEENCARCNPTGCTKCIDNWYVRAGACVDECNKGEFGALINPFDPQGGRECQMCLQCARGFGMDGCSGNSGGGCSYCAVGTWRPHLPNGATDTNQSCIPCSPCGKGFFASKQCYGSEDSVCSRCKHCAPGSIRSSCGIEGGSDETSPGKCKACPTGMFKDWYGTAEDQCSPCWTCGSDMFMSAPCTTSSDTGTCRDCTPCASGQYEMAPCDGDHDTVCAACKSCPAGFQTGSVAGGDASKTADLNCGGAADPMAAGVCVPCETGRFKASRYSVPGGDSLGDKTLVPAAWNEVCAPCTPCASDAFAYAVCTATHDNVCRACAGFGRNGIDWWTDPGTQSCERCTKCALETCTQNGKSKPCQVARACTQTSDALCGFVALDPAAAAAAQAAVEAEKTKTSIALGILIPFGILGVIVLLVVLALLAFAALNAYNMKKKSKQLAVHLERLEEEERQDDKYNKADASGAMDNMTMERLNTFRAKSGRPEIGMDELAKKHGGAVTFVEDFSHEEGFGESSEVAFDLDASDSTSEAEPFDLDAIEDGAAAAAKASGGTNQF